MIELTLQIPNDLALRLRPVQDRMTEIIELGLREITPTQYGLYNEVIEFLASGPTSQAIVAFRPSSDALERVSELLDKNRAGALTPDDQAELDQYERLDHLIALVKARARQRLAKAA